MQLRMIYGMIILMKRVTVTLPEELVDEIDRWEPNRSRFVLEASKRELEARRRDRLRRSLEAPHPDAWQVAEEGLVEWGAGRGVEDGDLLDPTAGCSVQWQPGEGWHEVVE